MGSTGEIQMTPTQVSDEELKLFAMVLKSAKELDLLEIIAKAGPGAYLSPSEIASQLPTTNPDAPVIVDRILPLLTSYSILTDSPRTLPDGRIERLYGAGLVCEFLIKNEDGVSIAPLGLKNRDNVPMQSCEKEVDSSTAFHEPLNFLITILLGVLGLHLRGLGISPPKEYDAIIAFFIMAVVMYGIAFLRIKLGPQNADYLHKLKFVCVICAILACELLASIVVDPLRLVMINLCGILVELICWYKQIYELLCYTANLVLKTSCSLFQKIYQSKFRQSASQAFNKFTLFGGAKKQDQDDDSQIAEIV